MISWIRVDCGTADDPAIARMAAVLKAEIPTMVGHVVGVYVKLPAHAPTGNVADVPDALLEDWAKWRGKRGAFAAQLRQELTVNGVLVVWAKQNAAAIREAEADANRKREERDRRRREKEAQREAERNGGRMSGGRSNGHKQDNHTDSPEERPVRNGVTSTVTLTGGSSSSSNYSPPTAREEGATAFETPLCGGCTAHMEPVQTTGKRLVRRLVHEAGCPLAPRVEAVS